MEMQKNLQARSNEINRNIEKIEEKYFVLEEMGEVTYHRFSAKYREERKEILETLTSFPIASSNQPNLLLKASNFCSNILTIWKMGDIALKENFQKLLFPLGIEYDRKTGAVRTEKTNRVIELIAELSMVSVDIKKGTNPFLSGKSPLAEKEGFEPPEVLPSTVFKTAAIDHSAISPLQK